MFKEINMYNLREGFVFSSDIVSEDGKVLLPAKTPLAKAHIIDWILKGINALRIDGDLIAGDSSTPLIIEMLEKEFLARSAEDVQHDAQFQNTPQYRLETSLLLERLIIKSEHVLQRLIQGSCKAEVFRKRVVWMSTKLVHLMQNTPRLLLDVISNTDTAYPHTTHAFRVALLGLHIGLSLDFHFNRLLVITIASLLHDIGKHTYEIINKKEQITLAKDDLKLRVTHPLYGYKLAREVLELQEEICQAILNHHEQPDGRGFPFQRESKDLFITDKIVYTANTFAHIIESTQLKGLEQPVTTFKHMVDENPEKFDSDLADTLLLLK